MLELVHWSIPAADNRLHWYAKTPERSLVALAGKPNRRGFDLPGAALTPSHGPGPIAPDALVLPDTQLLMVERALIC